MYHTIPVRSLYLTFLNPLPRNQRVLDVGCGSGYVIKTLEELGNEVVGLDRSIALVSSLTENGLRAKAYTLGCFEGFEGQSFDLILCFDVLEHVAKPDRPAFLNELFSWKTPTNSLLFSLPNYSSHGNPPDFSELREHLLDYPYRIGKIHYPTWYVLFQQMKSTLRRWLRIQEFDEFEKNAGFSQLRHRRSGILLSKILIASSFLFHLSPMRLEIVEEVEEGGTYLLLVDPH